MNLTAVLYALIAAALFGISTPVAKVLIGSVHPAVLAGLLYCGAGFGIAVLRKLPLGVFSSRIGSEAALGRSDLPWLAGAIVAGGVVGPLLLMVGLARTDAAAASLLLTLEGVATALMAWFIFHENFDRRIAIGMLCLVAGAIVLSWSGAPTLESALGPLAVIGACVAWGLDNNLTRKISLAGPVPALATAVVGFFSYGVSLALFVLALRHLGTARTAAYFSTAPFFGAVLAVGVLNEPVSYQLALAGAFMALGLWLHVTERHEHLHVHDAQAHSHSHVHDEAHQHEHRSEHPAGEPHTHRHVHEPLKHSH